MRIAIMGAGLAGTTMAYVLKQKGAEPVLYESSADIALGASGNEIGLYNPRFTAEQGPEQEFYGAAFFTALKTFKEINGIDWNPCGALHLITDEKKAKRFPKTVENWSWNEDQMRIVQAKEASEIAGLEIACDALYLSRSGTVSPHKLCHVYAKDVECHLNTQVQKLEDIGADIIVLAGGMGCLKFPQAAGLTLKPVRGQITFVRETKVSQNLRCTIGYGGYVTPAFDGKHCIGSSFQPWLDHSDIIPQDDADNLEKLFTAVPSVKGEFEVMGQRAAVRTTSKDHFPIIGPLTEKLYISTAHGSHGILSTLMGAHILSDMILENHTKISQSLLSALSPLRF